MPNHVQAADTGLSTSPLYKRRHIITALPIVAAGCAVPVLAQSPNSGSDELTRSERIQRHAEALLALIRPDLPEETTSMTVSVRSNWGPSADLQNRISVDACVMTIEWEENERLRGGGMWVGKNLGSWSEGRFYA